MSSILSKIFKWYTKSTFFAFFHVLFIFSHMYVCFLQFQWGWGLNGAYQYMKNVNVAGAWKCIKIYFSDKLWLIKNWVFGVINFEIQLLTNINWFWVPKRNLTWFNKLYTTIFMFTNLDFIHTRICYGFLNENDHQEYSVLFVTINDFSKCVDNYIDFSKQKKEF
jgi:hypothetical protein